MKVHEILPYDVLSDVVLDGDQPSQMPTIYKYYILIVSSWIKIEQDWRGSIDLICSLEADATESKKTRSIICSLLY